ncbi:MAG: heavy-metal-associated domain-containing protein [Deltaproteobacteria bacterium]|nr:heavy-metal-associated domain-containing protein [Deltaproteobacteria bacterium]
MTVPGVRTVIVDFDNKEAVVSYAAPATVDAMAKAVEGAGHYNCKFKHDGMPELRHTLAPLGAAVDAGVPRGLDVGGH